MHISRLAKMKTAEFAEDVQPESELCKFQKLVYINSVILLEY